MFVKPRSSKCLTKRSLDITSFSGCVSSSRSAISCSSEPAFTPMRIAHPAAPAASITASTLAQSPILPGLMRSLAAPASTAPMASLWLKWISATIGTGDSAQMVRKPSSAASVGTLTRTISQPACANAHTCASVAWASAVSVQVMDWTTTGAPPPICTPPTCTGRVNSRGKGWDKDNPNTPLQNKSKDVGTKHIDKQQRKERDAHIAHNRLDLER